MAKSLDQIYANATWTHNELIKRGIPEPAASYATYQIYHETGAYNNRGWNELRNASGIMFAGQKGASRSTNGYANFDNWDNYFTSYVHELTKRSNPARAQTLEDFNQRLIANKYYTANPSEYLSGLKRARLVLKSLPATQRAGLDPATGTYISPTDTDIVKQPTPWLGIAAAAAILLAVKKIFFR